MSVTAIKKEPAPQGNSAIAAVVRMPAPRASITERLTPYLRAFAINVVPPVVTLIALLLIWQLLCDKPGATLPAPTVVWNEAKDLILEPFFNLGSQDVGLGWRVLVSLQRVLIGFGLAAIVGVLVGCLIGQSVWAMRGLDPIFQVLRTVPPLAWLPISLAAFRDSSPSAIFVIFITSIWPIIINTAVGIRNIPMDYRNVAAVLRLNAFEFFARIMIPSAAPYIFTGLRIGIGADVQRLLQEPDGSSLIAIDRRGRQERECLVTGDRRVCVDAAQVDPVALGMPEILDAVGRLAQPQLVERVEVEGVGPLPAGQLVEAQATGQPVVAVTPAQHVGAAADAVGVRRCAW